MKARIAIITILLGFLAGCTDTADSVSREYRNQINEGLDALMFVTTEESAKQMSLRIFKPMGDRFTDIDRRLGIVRSNRTKKEFVTEFFESDSVHMYLSEISINRQRFALEKTRIRDLVQQYKKRDEECPSLLALVDDGADLGPLKTQLEQPKINEYIASFGDWKIDNFPELLAKFKAKREKFAPRGGLNLVK